MKSVGVKLSGVKSVGVMSVVVLLLCDGLGLENENPPSRLWWVRSDMLGFAADR